MPRKTVNTSNNSKDEITPIAKKANSSTSKTTTKSSSSIVKATTKKSSDSTSKTSTKKSSGSTSKTSTNKSSSSTIKTAAKKSSRTTVKSNNVKSKSSEKKLSKSTRNTKIALGNINPEKITSSTNLTKKINILEYYDLPYRYNQTVVKVLAQTPTTLFIYWDISDEDRNNFVKQYGENFFNDTKPVLIIHNKTMNYSFEIDIDDFANSWYLHVNDANCEYYVELGRRNKNNQNVKIPDNYLYVSSSNIIDAPNDHVLFDKSLNNVYFRDVKTNIVSSKGTTSISFLRNIGKLYGLYNLYNDSNNNVKVDNASSSSSITLK